MFQGLNTEGITVILVTHDPDVAAFANPHDHMRRADRRRRGAGRLGGRLGA